MNVRSYMLGKPYPNLSYSPMMMKAMIWSYEVWCVPDSVPDWKKNMEKIKLVQNLVHSLIIAY